MNELIKRIYTSIFLIFIFSLSLFVEQLLYIVLIFCFYLLFFEFFNIIKIIFKDNKNIQYLCLLISLFLICYLVLFVWISLNSNNFNKIFLLMIISISIGTDIGGFIFGKIFKGKKLSTISPNKTYSGMFGSYFLSIILITFLFKDFIEIKYLIFFTLVLSSISQLGDLFISYLKRKSKLKDTGKLLPGHGGMLDRFDGILFAILFGSIIKNLI